MKSRVHSLALAFLMLSIGAVAQAQPADTVFTYQGKLETEASPGGPLVPADGVFDFSFAIFASEINGTALTAPVLLHDISVIDGVFSVPLDFGTSILNGGPTWLAISVRDGNSNGSYTPLNPRQNLTSTPFAMHAEFVPGNSIGQVEIDSSQVQRRVNGTCAVGSYVTAIHENGTVSCAVATGTDSQTLSVSGSVLSISGGNMVDLSGIPNTADEILTKIQTVDGENSALDADLLDGMHADTIINNAVDNTVDLLAPTIIESLPYTINEPGAYAIKQNLRTTFNSTAAIRIMVDDVFLDLGGYSISPGDGVTTGTAISAPSRSNIRIQNGTVHGFNGQGMILSGSDHIVLKNITSHSNGGTGVYLESDCFVDNVHAYDNGSDGIRTGLRCTVKNSFARNNAGDGFNGSNRTLILDSQSFDNAESGFRVSASSQIHRSIAHSNDEHGFELVGSVYITESRAHQNMWNGISATSGSRIINNSVSFNGEDISAADNMNNGIAATHTSLIKGNRAYGNRGSGIYSTSSSSTIDGNQLNTNTRHGIEVTGVSNFVIRNIARLNNSGNYQIANSNAYGPIASVNGIGNISSNASASHPMANFSQ
jgi:parallel beta-helix repeat protein